MAVFQIKANLYYHIIKISQIFWKYKFNNVVQSMLLKYQKFLLKNQKEFILLIKNQDFTQSPHFPTIPRRHTTQQTVLLRSQIVDSQTR